MNNEDLRSILNQISNIDREHIFINFDLFSNNDLEKIAQELKSRREEIEIVFDLGKDEKIKGITALMQVLENKPKIIKIGLHFEENQQLTPDSSLKIFIDTLNKNNRISNLTITFKGFVPNKTLLDTIYSMVENHPSIKALFFYDSYHVDLYLDQFLKLKKLTSINLRYASYSDYKNFFSNLKIPENLKTFMVKCDSFDENDICTFISFLNAVKKSKITKLSLEMPRFTKMQGGLNPYNLLTAMLKTKRDLTSLSLSELYNFPLALHERQSLGLGCFISAKSSVENFCDYLKETKTLKKLDIYNIRFRSISYNEKAFYSALSSNKSLTELKLQSIFPLHDERNRSELFDAIFSNPNLKSLKLDDMMSSASLIHLIKVLKSNRTLTKLGLNCASSADNQDELFSKMLEVNSTLEYCDLRGSGCGYNDSNKLFLEALKKNTTRNLIRLKLGKVHADINAELERNYQLKKLQITNTFLRGVYCKQSPLNALKGFQGPLGLIYSFLYEKERSQKIVESKETKETKETKEMKEMKEIKELQENQKQSVILKKSREEALMTKQNQAILQRKDCN